MRLPSMQALSSDDDITRPHLGGSTQAGSRTAEWVQCSDSDKRKIPLFSPGGGSGAPNTHEFTSRAVLQGIPRLLWMLVDLQMV
jgi:hypothetical protein